MCIACTYQYVLADRYVKYYTPASLLTIYLGVHTHTVCNTPSPHIHYFIIHTSLPLQVSLFRLAAPMTAAVRTRMPSTRQAHTHKPVHGRTHTHALGMAACLLAAGVCLPIRDVESNRVFRQRDLLTPAYLQSSLLPRAPSPLLPLASPRAASLSAHSEEELMQRLQPSQNRGGVWGRNNSSACLVHRYTSDDGEPDPDNNAD
jgi:hypothetical protein